MDVQRRAVFDQDFFSAEENWKIDTEKHLVRFDPGGDILVVSFDPYGWAKDWSNPDDPPASWGGPFLAKQGYSTLGVLSKQSVWFREPALFETFDAIARSGFFARFKRVVFYGASKGGYGALAFSSYAPGAHVLAFAPQTTLHKPLVPFETRKYPAVGNWSGPVIDGATEAARAASVQVFYDPYRRIDKLHVDRLQSQNVIHYRCRYWGHDLPVSLSGLGLLSSTVKQAIEGDLSPMAFTRAVRGVRRPRRYYRYLVDHLIAAGKYKIALRIVDHRLPKKTDYNFLMLRKAVLLSHLGNVDEMGKILYRYETLPQTKSRK